MNSLKKFLKKVQFVHWQVQSKCFRTIACQLNSNEFLETSQSFYSCIARCNQSASKSLLVNWKAIYKLIEASRSFYSCIGRCSEVLPKHCLSTEKQWFGWSCSKFPLAYWQAPSTCFQAISFQVNGNEFLEAPWSFWKFLFVYWQVKSKCFQIIAVELKSSIPWGVSKFLFVHWQVKSKCFQSIAFESKGQRPLQRHKVSTCIGRCNPDASKSLPVDWKAMTSFKLNVSRFLFLHWLVQSCFQIIAFQLQARDFLRCLKVSIRVFAGAIQMLSNHC